ncbi:MAG: hypothetical protein ACE5H9_14760, partial [Anaerolineae bacterium]
MRTFITTTVWQRYGLGWIVGLALGLPLAWLAVGWLEQNYPAGTGWMSLSLAVLLGGIGWRLYRQGRQEGAACATTWPNVSPLQVSCLAAQALGIQWLLFAGSFQRVGLLPIAAWSGWPYLSIAAGLLGLGWFSLHADCHDEALSG